MKNKTHARIRLDPKNARRHGDRNKAMIRESLEAVGPLRSIGVDGDDIIRAGNGVYEQAEALGLKVRVVDAKPDELIAVRRKDLKGKRAVEAALYDNRAGETSEWNVDVLAEIAARDGDLVGRLFEGEREILAAISTAGDGVGITPHATLAERFIIPPFSVLDARQGYWQERKRAWIALGIQSEIGRGDVITERERERVVPRMAMHNDPMQRKERYNAGQTQRPEVA